MNLTLQRAIGCLYLLNLQSQKRALRVLERLLRDQSKRRRP